MEEKQINIKSSTIEAGLELAKDFLGKLITPTVEETGLLIGDQMRFIRFKREVDILVKAKAYVDKKGIKIKELPLKMLVPLLENASLEDKEEIQDKWVNMLVNMVDSESNLRNHIFPFILSQISIDEFNTLKKMLLDEKDFRENREKLRELKKNNRYAKYSNEGRELSDKVEPVEQTGFLVFLQEFEIANLVRLGLIKKMPPMIHIPEVDTSDDYRQSGTKEYLTIEASYDTDKDGYRITELGEKFIEICELKDK